METPPSEGNEDGEERGQLRCLEEALNLLAEIRKAEKMYLRESGGTQLLPRDLSIRVEDLLREAGRYGDL